MQLLSSYSLPINRPLSVPPVLFDSLFRLPWLQDMKVRLFVSTLNALHSLIFLPTCPYKACTVRGCLSSHPLWIEQAEEPIALYSLGTSKYTMNQVKLTNQTKSQTQQVTKQTLQDSHKGLLRLVNLKLFLSMKYAEKPNLWQNWPRRVQYSTEQSWWCVAEMPMNYPFSADFPFSFLKIKVKFRRYKLMQTRTRRQALLCPQTPHQQEMQMPQHKLPMLSCALGRTPGCVSEGRAGQSP